MLWDSEPLVAVTLTWYVPGAALPELMLSVELPDPLATSVMVGGFRPAIGPDEETDAVRVTVPVNELMLVTVMDDWPEDPRARVKDVGLAERLKSEAAVT
jgi:hypothetical protein